jgi:hypothetical protein
VNFLTCPIYQSKSWIQRDDDSHPNRRTDRREGAHQADKGPKGRSSPEKQSGTNHRGFCIPHLISFHPSLSLARAYNGGGAPTFPIPLPSGTNQGGAPIFLNRGRIGDGGGRCNLYESQSRRASSGTWRSGAAGCTSSGEKSRLLSRVKVNCNRLTWHKTTIHVSQNSPHQPEGVICLVCHT